MSKSILLSRGSKIDPSIFSNDSGKPYCDKKLFLSRYEVLPSQIIDYDIECIKFSIYFEKTYQKEIVEEFYTLRIQRNNSKKPKEKKDDRYFLFEIPLLVYVDVQRDMVKILFDASTESKAIKIKKGLDNFGRTLDEETPEMNLITRNHHGLDLTAMKLAKMETDLSSNYNDNFLHVHDTIIQRLKTPKDKGVVILHGEPGTGKTSYIRHLISCVSKKVIFLPPNLAHNITGPELINLLIENPESILIIEDAENIVVDRDKTGSSPVSAILNISDGLLSDCLQTQIICSFNTSLDNVDKALLRKGRLIAKYNFKPLAVQKANELSIKLGFQHCFIEPTPLTEIFNQQEKTYQLPRRKAIGF
jgi:hypothetical protein